MTPTNYQVMKTPPPQVASFQGSARPKAVLPVSSDKVLFGFPKNPVIENSAFLAKLKQQALQAPPHQPLWIMALDLDHTFHVKGREQATRDFAAECATHHVPIVIITAGNIYDVVKKIKRYNLPEPDAVC